MQPWLGLVPIALIAAGICFRSRRTARYLAYLGAVAWTLVGFLYVAGHLD